MPRLAEARLAITRPDAKVPMVERIYRVPSYATARQGGAEFSARGVSGRAATGP